MVTEYGMSDLGPVQLEHKEEGVFLGRDYNKTRNFSDKVALEIDQEVRKIVNECYEKATKILKDNEKLVKLLSDTLIEKETITKEEIDELVATGKLSSKNNEEKTEVKEEKKKTTKKSNKDTVKETKEK